MGFISNLFSKPSTPDIPIVKQVIPAPTVEDEPVRQARRDFLAKQAALSAKNKTIATNALGIAPDILQTSKKALLGG